MRRTVRFRPHINQNERDKFFTESAQLGKTIHPHSALWYISFGFSIAFTAYSAQRHRFLLAQHLCHSVYTPDPASGAELSSEKVLHSWVGAGRGGVYVNSRRPFGVERFGITQSIRRGHDQRAGGGGVAQGFQ